jgi:hypothetical protein
MAIQGRVMQETTKQLERSSQSPRGGAGNNVETPQRLHVLRLSRRAQSGRDARIQRPIRAAMVFDRFVLPIAAAVPPRVAALT